MALSRRRLPRQPLAIIPTPSSSRYGLSITGRVKHPLKARANLALRYEPEDLGQQNPMIFDPAWGNHTEIVAYRQLEIEGSLVETKKGGIPGNVPAKAKDADRLCERIEDPHLREFCWEYRD